MIPVRKKFKKLNNRMKKVFSLIKNNEYITNESWKFIPSETYLHIFMEWNSVIGMYIKPYCW